MNAILHRGSLLALATLTLAACDAATSSGPVSADARSSSRCQNVAFQGEADLGAPVFIPPPPGEAAPIVGAGGVPSTVDLGPWTGSLSSVLTSETRSGNGAVHYTLVHYFVEDGTGDAFWTRDRAVCAPAGGGALTCRLNDVLNVFAGTGKFEDAGGSLRNHGVITITDPTGNPFGTLTVDLRGRLCGDGL